MSGQWEVVRGKNDRRNNKVTPPKTSNKPSETKNKKNNILNGVKIEEVLPKSQVQNLYSGKPSNKENKPQEKVKNIEIKKSEKKPKAPPEPSKPKIPKSIEAALMGINNEEFHSVYVRSKTAFPDAPILWLKALTQFLNQKIPLEIQDPVFSTKSQGFPLNVVPSNLRTTLEKAIKESGKSNAQLYFDIALTSMVTDLSKGLPAVGYRFFLQHIAMNEPKLVTDNLPKHIILRNSYQNRANIALSILWAVGHVGISDLNCGLKVFEELMLPLLELKNYSHYIVRYLLELTSRNYETQITKDQYLLILDVIYSNRKNFPVALQKDLTKNLLKLKVLLFKNNNEKYHSYVEPFLKKLVSNNRNNNTGYQTAICDIIVEIFTKDHSTLASWNKVYGKNLPASATLLNYISDNYDNIHPNLQKAIKNVLLSFTNINQELSLKKRKDEGLKDVILGIEKLQERKPTAKRRGGFFKKLFVFSVFAAIVFIFTEPLRYPSKPREELFIVQLTSNVTNLAVTGLSWVDAKLEENIPEQYELVKTFVKPYWSLARDVGKIAYNIQENARQSCIGFVKEKYPIVLASVDSYAPGLIDNTQTIFKEAFTKSVYYYRTSVNYLQKEVFVGQLSPENIQRVVIQAYNTTSEKAIEYYHWAYQKVQTSIK